MRCFVAIELPEDVRERLARLQSDLSELDRVVRWTRPEQIHLTLKFLGEVPDDQVAGVGEATVAAASSCRAFNVTVGGVGCFPISGAPRVIWAGVTGPPPDLLTCQKRCETEYAALGYPPEGRAFSPHLTLGRTREGSNARMIRPKLQSLATFTGGTFSVRELVLFQSILGRGGATHVALARAPLSRE